MTRRLVSSDAERAARIIEWLFADLEELRAARQFASHGMRTDIPDARVTLLDVLSIATEGDLMGEAHIELSESEAKVLYLSLHRHAANGYERGDCHCDHCDNVVNTLVVYFGVQKPSTGIYSPAALVREEAVKRGWEPADG